MALLAPGELSQFPCDRSPIHLAAKSAAALTEMNVLELLPQKELELARVKKEVAALRIVAPLLREEADHLSETGEPTLTVPIIRQLLAQDDPVVYSPDASSTRKGRWRDAAKYLFRGSSIGEPSEVRK